MIEGFFNRRWCCVLTRRFTFSFGCVVLIHTIQMATVFFGCLLWFLHCMGVMPITSGVTLFVIGTVINIFSVTPIGEYFMYDGERKAWTIGAVNCIHLIFAVFCIGFIAGAWNDRADYGFDWKAQVDRLSTLLAVIVCCFVAFHFVYRLKSKALPFLLAFAIMITNSTFALYYIPTVQHYLICSVGCAVLLFTSIKLFIDGIFGRLKNWKLNVTIFFLVCWQIAAFGVALNTAEHWDETIDAEYQTFTIQRNVFYLVQTLPLAVAAVTLIVWILYGAVQTFNMVPECCRSCRDSIRVEVNEAKQIAENEAKKEIETPFSSVKTYQSV